MKGPQHKECVFTVHSRTWWLHAKMFSGRTSCIVPLPQFDKNRRYKRATSVTWHFIDHVNLKLQKFILAIRGLKSSNASRQMNYCHLKVIIAHMLAKTCLFTHRADTEQHYF